jgi:hypothetical protein
MLDLFADAIALSGRVCVSRNRGHRALALAIAATLPRNGPGGILFPPFNPFGCTRYTRNMKKGVAGLVGAAGE